MILTHGANSIPRGGESDTTEWDTANVPTDYIVTNGGVKAIPYDNVGLSNKVVSFKKNSATSSDNVGLSNKVVSFTLIQ